MGLLLSGLADSGFLDGHPGRSPVGFSQGTSRGHPGQAILALDDLLPMAVTWPSAMSRGLTVSRVALMPMVMTWKPVASLNIWTWGVLVRYPLPEQ